MGVTDDGRPAFGPASPRGLRSDRRAAQRPAPTGTEGHGLTGMRERARACGGSVTAGREGGGWAVRARLPRAAR